MSGSALPVTGAMPVTHAMFTQAWKPIMTVNEPANMQPSMSGALRQMRMPAKTKSPKSATTRTAPMRPSSSPTMA